MDKEIFEVVLSRAFNDFKIKRIIEMKSEPALPKGENFASTIFRITAKVVLGNGRIATKKFIAKKRNAGQDLKIFNSEVSIYTKILREMEYLMEEFEDTEGPLWCEFIHYSQSDSTIVLEDLKALGFDTVRRSEAQDLDHARLVLRSLGRYHAMAKVLEQRGIVSKDGYKPYTFLNDDVHIRNLLYGGKQALVKGMKLAWGEEWSEYAAKLGKLTYQELSRRIKECDNFDDNAFKCLNHGDCWNNNTMFKNNWEGKPIEMRFVDFQAPHYTSPCIDVTYFMYTSIKPRLRHQNYKTLVELYHESLTNSLDKFGYQGPKPSLEDINNAMEKLSFFGLCFFTISFPCVLTTRTDAVDFDLIFKTNGEEGHSISVYYEDGIKEKIEEDVKALVKALES